MRFYIAITSTILLLSGCGAMKQVNSIGTNNGGPTAQFSRYSPHSPQVVFIGDDVTANWFPKTSIWINKGIAGQTSDQVLARFQADVVSLHPDIVHIVVGTNDVYPGSWDFCGYGTTGGAAPPGPDTCANITQMVTEAQAAGIKVILGTIPPNGPPTPEGVGVYENITELNSWITAYGAVNNITVVNYHDLLTEPSQLPPNNFYTQEYVPAYTANGIDPNAGGYAVMTPLAQAAIGSLNVSGTKRPD